MNVTTPSILAARDEMIAAQCLRGDSKLRQLSDEHFTAVVQWLAEGISTVSVALLCKEPVHKGGLGLPPAKAPGKSGLYEFWSAYARFLQRQRRAEAAEEANRAGAEARSSTVDWEKANADKIQQLTFETLSDPNLDAKAVKVFVMAALKIKSLENDKEKLAQAERKLNLLEKREANAKDTLADEKLTPEERQRKMREIFGLPA